jgi:hypothetical protein
MYHTFHMQHTVRMELLSLPKHLRQGLSMLLLILSYALLTGFMVQVWDDYLESRTTYQGDSFRGRRRLERFYASTLSVRFQEPGQSNNAPSPGSSKPTKRPPSKDMPPFGSR